MEFDSVKLLSNNTIYFDTVEMKTTLERLLRFAKVDHFSAANLIIMFPYFIMYGI